MDLMQVMRSFPDRESCIRYLEEIRWSGTPQCAHCNSQEVGRTNAKGRPGLFNCYDCKSTFNVLCGTIFYRSRIPLQKWFAAIHLVLKAKKGISSPQLARSLEMNVTSAWYLMVRIRREIEKQDADIVLCGIIEADESWVGGRPKGKRILDRIEVDKQTGKKRKYYKNRPTEKMVYIGAIERREEGRVSVKLAEGKHQPRAESLHSQVQGFIHEKVDTKNSTLMTDGFNGYKALGEIMPHYTIEKGEGDYAREREFTEEGDKISTTRIEGFWANIKRAWYGTHHWYSEKYAPLYIAEVCYKFNRRKGNDLFGEFVAECFPSIS